MLLDLTENDINCIITDLTIGIKVPTSDLNKIFYNTELIKKILSQVNSNNKNEGATTSQ